MKNRSAVSKAYNPEVDFWKFIFAVFVLLHHLFHLVPGIYFFRRGYISVEFFFFVSGYFLAAKACSGGRDGVSPPPTHRFLYGRIKSLYKPFIAAFLITFIVREIAVGNSIFAMAKDLLVSGYETGLMRLSGFEIGTFFNAPTWYLSAMFLAMAVLWPLAVKFRRPFFRIACPLITFFFWALVFAKTGTIGPWKSIVAFDFLQSGLVRAFAGLAFGMFIYECCAMLKETNLRPTKIANVFFFILELATLAVVVFYMSYAEKHNWDRKYDFCVVLYLALFVFIMFSGLSGIRDRFAGTDLSALSKASLYIYLCHWASVQLLGAIYGDAVPHLRQVILPYIGVTLCSIALCRALVFLFDLFLARLWPGIKNKLFVKV
ncbi:MAG: acyltransferase family protein [Clostridia bacterium]|nr:acyltransferase family protein [Clostridia bacterium]